MLVVDREFSKGYVKDKWQSVVGVTTFRHSRLLGSATVLMKQAEPTVSSFTIPDRQMNESVYCLYRLKISLHYS